MAITIKIVQKTSDYELSLRSIRFHDLAGAPVVKTNGDISPYMAPSGPWNAFRTSQSHNEHVGGEGWNAFDQLVDFQCGYWGKRLRPRGGVKFVPSDKWRYWHNFYHQRYDSLYLGSPDSFKTYGSVPGGKGLNTYSGGTSAVALATYLPLTRMIGLSSNGYDPNRLDEWSIVRSFPSNLNEASRKQFSLTLNANHHHWFYDKFGKDRSADLGTLIATSPELIGLFYKLKDILLNLKNPINLLKRKQTSPLELFNALREIAGLWLTYSFGIKPLVKDVGELIEFFTHNIDDFGTIHSVKFDAGMKYPAREVKIGYGTQRYGCKPALYQFSSQREVNRTYCKVTTDGISGNRFADLFQYYDVSDADEPGSDYDLHDHMKCVYTRKASHEYLVRSNPNYIFTQLGLNNPAMWAWELIPFSFVVDYVAKIGDYIENRNALAGLEILASLHSIEEEWTAQSRWSSARCVQYNRVTGHETDGVLIRDPSSFQYNAPYSSGTLAIPRAEVEWAEGVDLSESFNGGKASNALATSILLLDMASTVKQAKAALVSASSLLPNKMQRQVRKLISVL